MRSFWQDGHATAPRASRRSPGRGGRERARDGARGTARAGTDKPGADPEARAVEVLTAIVAAVRRRAHALYEGTGVTPLRLQALHVLRDAGPLTVSGLAARLHLNLSTVSALADRMAAGGLVRKAPRPGDRRVVMVAPGPRAAEVLARAPVSPFGLLSRALAPLTRAEKASLVRILEKVAHGLGVDLPPAPGDGRRS